MALGVGGGEQVEKDLTSFSQGKASTQKEIDLDPFEILALYRHTREKDNRSAKRPFEETKECD